MLSEYKETYIADVLVDVRVEPIVNNKIPSSVIVGKRRRVPPVLSVNNIY